MLILKVARLSGVSDKALRYYEDIGLTDPPERSTSGYRIDADGVLPRLGFMKSAQALGFTLGRSAASSGCASLMSRRADMC